MATKKFSPAQLAAQKLFAERARSGTLKKGKRKANPTNKPMAAQGLVSYRYKGRYGFIMIGAKDDDDALNEAKRSTRGAVTLENLEVYNGKKYEPVLKRNPNKAKPRAYVKRASQATGAPPSKRLVTRRKKALTAPAGYFPNPKTKKPLTLQERSKKFKIELGFDKFKTFKKVVGYYPSDSSPDYELVALFQTQAQAVNAAESYAENYPKYRWFVKGL